MLNPAISCFENNVDPGLLASEIHTVFHFACKYMNIVYVHLKYIVHRLFRPKTVMLHNLYLYIHKSSGLLDPFQTYSHFDGKPKVVGISSPEPMA